MFGKLKDLFNNMPRAGGIVTDGDVVGGTYRGKTSMATIKYNGMTLTGDNITINGKRLVVDGKMVDGVEIPQESVIRIEGGVANVVCDRSLTCGDVTGHVTANGPVTCGSIGGDVDAKGPVTAKNIEGNVKASGPVTAGRIGGRAGDIYP